MRNKLGKITLAAGFVLALAFTFGCSSNYDPPTPPAQQEESNSSEGKVPNHCVYMEEKLCLHGANPCPDGGTPSEECPFLSSSSTGETQDKSNSSSNEKEQSSSSVQEFGYCIFVAEKICLEIETSCPSSATFSKTCPYSSSSSRNSGSSSIVQSSNSEPLKECDALFDPNKKFCYDGSVYDICNGMTYNPTNNICVGNILETKCGSKSYNASTHFCYDDVIYYKCGGTIEYNPTIYICKNEVATPAKCDGLSYNPLINVCWENVITPASYCDYGYPTSYGGGCVLMKDMDDCNLAWGKVVTSCGARTDLIYCFRGANHCYSRTTISCDSGDSKVSNCPESTLCNTSSCTYDCKNDYGPYGCR